MKLPLSLVLRSWLAFTVFVSLPAFAQPVDREELQSALRFLALHRVEVYVPIEPDHGVTNGTAAVHMGVAAFIPSALALWLLPKRKGWTPASQTLLEAFAPPFAATGAMMVVMGGVIALSSLPKRNRLLARDPDLRRRRDLVNFLNLPFDDQVAALIEDEERANFVIGLARTIHEREITEN